MPARDRLPASPDDRIEITDPGEPRVDTQRFVDMPPRSRNETLASLMRPEKSTLELFDFFFANCEHFEEDYDYDAVTTATYWEIGWRIVEYEQRGKARAEYGDAVLKELGRDLAGRYGRGFGWRNLFQMRGFCLAYPVGKLQTPSAISAGEASQVSGKSATLSRIPARIQLFTHRLKNRLSLESPPAFRCPARPACPCWR